MNKRIYELAEKAKTHVLARIDEDDSDWDDQHTVLYNQKFAELILRQCMEIADTHQNRGDALSSPLIAEKIKEYFGVDK